MVGERDVMPIRVRGHDKDEWLVDYYTLEVGGSRWDMGMNLAGPIFRGRDIGMVGQ